MCVWGGGGSYCLRPQYPNGGKKSKTTTMLTWRDTEDTMSWHQHWDIAMIFPFLKQQKSDLTVRVPSPKAATNADPPCPSWVDSSYSHSHSGARYVQFCIPVKKVFNTDFLISFRSANSVQSILEFNLCTVFITCLVYCVIFFQLSFAPGLKERKKEEKKKEPIIDLA